MKKHILIFCLALALCLSMIPAAGAVYAAPSYTVIATGIEATDVDILDNGYCGYIVYDGYEIPRKGIIAPSGKAIVTRDFGDDPIYMGVYGATNAVKDGKVFVLKFAEPAPVDPNDVSNIFQDVPADAWYKTFLQKAYDSKIIAGTSATTVSMAGRART